MSIISIQSQVLHGHVGNSAATFPLQLGGFEVAAVPTALLSNHGAYPSVHGKVLDAEFIADLLVGLEERGVAESAKVIMTGYIGSAEIGAVVADFIARTKKINPGLVYLCDPVLGEVGKGFYVKPAVQETMRDLLVPLADIITPNRFEFAYLGHTDSIEDYDVIEAARALGKRTVLVTGGSLPVDDALRTFAIDQRAAFVVETPQIVTRASGTGDLLAALFVAHTLTGSSTESALGASVSGVYAMLEATLAADARELQLIASAKVLYAPARSFTAKLV